jgi:iron-sulfur cluster assembly accessory protein
MQIDMTPAAARFIGRLLRWDGGPGAGLRLLVSPGGCSGMTAEFSVQPEPQEGDAAIEVAGLRLFLPAQSRLLLDGATIDFAETADSTGLRFHNPAAPSACSH